MIIIMNSHHLFLCPAQGLTEKKKNYQINNHAQLRARKTHPKPIFFIRSTLQEWRRATTRPIRNHLKFISFSVYYIAFDICAPVRQNLCSTCRYTTAQLSTTTLSNLPYRPVIHSNTKTIFRLCERRSRIMVNTFEKEKLFTVRYRLTSSKFVPQKYE